MSYEPRRIGELKVGRFVIDPDSGESCKIISLDKSKPGKHGSAKARIAMVGLFDNQKRQLVSPVDKRINVPIIDKRNAQVTNLSQDGMVSLMDMETYEAFEARLPKEKEIQSKLKMLVENGKVAEVEYWVVGSPQGARKKIIAVRELQL